MLIPTRISSIWQVAREYAGIAEAGGVKNVVCSLSEALVRAGIDVTVFLPYYGCVTPDRIPGLAPLTTVLESEIEVACVLYPVAYRTGTLNGVRIILVDSPVFREKSGVYTYTDADENILRGRFRGHGHFDVDIMNLLLQKSVLFFSKKTGFAPNILHCQDAHTALLPAYAKTCPVCGSLFSRTSFFVTIHNAGPGYRQTIHSFERARDLTGFSEQIISQAMLNGIFEPFLCAAQFAALTTVSPWYAQELTNPRFDSSNGGISGELCRRGFGITGITNGIDYSRYNPTDTRVSLLPFSFNPETGDLRGKYLCRDSLLSRIRAEKTAPELVQHGSLEPPSDAVYFVYHGRIARQKGLYALAAAIEQVLAAVPRAVWIITGQGEPELENMLSAMARTHTGRLVYLRGYERSFARLCVASGDFLVLPSVFEPCGLEDLIGQIYGTIPVARATGGLQKILHNETGFLYESGENDGLVLAELCKQLAEQLHSPDPGADHPFQSLITRAALRVHELFNWDQIVQDGYLPLFAEYSSSASEKRDEFFVEPLTY